MFFPSIAMDTSPTRELLRGGSLPLRAGWWDGFRILRSDILLVPQDDWENDG